jgi:hypothetical protein
MFLQLRNSSDLLCRMIFFVHEENKYDAQLTLTCELIKTLLNDKFILYKTRLFVMSWVREMIRGISTVSEALSGHDTDPLANLKYTVELTLLHCLKVHCKLFISLCQIISFFLPSDV